MAKCVYAFLTYPESCDTVALVSRLSDMGFAFAHSPVHDNDLLSEPIGEQIYKKPHVHWLVGFESKPPKVNDFVSFVRSLGGVSAPQETLVKNPWKAVEYFTHKNNPEKAQYKEADCFYSDSWDLERYTTQEQRYARRVEKRSQQKQEDSAIIGEILDMCGSEPGKCNGFQPLVDKVRKEKPLYFPVLLKNAFFVREYLRSLIVEKRLETSLSKEVDRLNRIVSDLSRENRDLQDRCEFAEQSAACYYEQLHGESLPASWEWGKDDNAPIEGSPLEQIGMTELDFQ